MDSTCCRLRLVETGEAGDEGRLGRLVASIPTLVSALTHFTILVKVLNLRFSSLLCKRVSCGLAHTQLTFVKF